MLLSKAPTWKIKVTLSSDRSETGGDGDALMIAGLEAVGAALDLEPITEPVGVDGGPEDPDALSQTWEAAWPTSVLIAGTGKAVKALMGLADPHKRGDLFVTISAVAELYDGTRLMFRLGEDVGETLEMLIRTEHWDGEGDQSDAPTLDQIGANGIAQVIERLPDTLDGYGDSAGAEGYATWVDRSEMVAARELVPYKTTVIWSVQPSGIDKMGTDLARHWQKMTGGVEDFLADFRSTGIAADSLGLEPVVITSECITLVPADRIEASLDRIGAQMPEVVADYHDDPSAPIAHVIGVAFSG